jgi:predicted ATP-grasp superfamily ATP-dependent carboligase
VLTRNNSYRTPAIVCDAEKLSQVAIIQELGRSRIPVIALAGTSAAPGFASRYVSRCISSPVASYDPEYIDFLHSSVPRGVLFYSNDANTENISRHRNSLLAAGFSLLISDISTLERVIDKGRLYWTGLECGVSVPQCAFVSSIDEMKSKISEYGLPVILKATNLAGGVYRMIGSTESAADVFREMREIVASGDHRHRSARLIVQRWIPQATTKLWNFNACVKAGEIISFSMGERIRSDIYPDGRLGSILLFGRTMYNEHIYQLNKRLLQHIRFEGIVETEWSEGIADTPDTFLYDFNPRPSGNIRWSFKSGVSLAVQYYELALGLPPQHQTMRNGVVYAKVFYRWSDPVEALTNSQLPLRGKLAVLKDDILAVVLCRRHAVDILDLADLGPTVRATGELSRNLFRRFWRRIKRWSCNSAHFVPKLKHASR